MFRSIALGLGLALSTAALAQDATGFHKRFQIVKNAQGKNMAIRLKAISTRFTIMPFIEQVKNDLIEEQRRWRNKSAQEHEAYVDAQLLAMGLNPNKGGEEGQHAQDIRESLLNIPNIPVQQTFAALERDGLMGEFEGRIQDALIHLDLAAVAHLEDPRFHYRRNVAYAVVTWALDQAKKRFASVPLLNLASFVIVKVHDLLHEQRMFHHNMMLHYFERVPEAALGMTREEVDRAISSVYEYRIAPTDIMTSNRVARDFNRYGWNLFYAQLRMGNTRERELSMGFGDGVRYAERTRLNFGFSEFKNGADRKIYHLLMNAHMFSSKPALAYDFAKPDKVKRERALMNLAQVALGFLPVVPGWIKGPVDSFINSMHVEQRRLEGALVAHFDLNGDTAMMDTVYKQNINPYLVR